MPGFEFRRSDLHIGIGSSFSARYHNLADMLSRIIHLVLIKQIHSIDINTIYSLNMVLAIDSVSSNSDTSTYIET